MSQNSTLLIEEMQRIVSDWHRKRFPEFYSMDNYHQVQTLLMKLTEETGEVIAGFNKGSAQGKLAHETMDVIVVSLQVLEILGQSAELKFDEVMEKNNARLSA